MRDLQLVTEIFLEVVSRTPLLFEGALLIDGAPVALVVNEPTGVETRFLGRILNGEGSRFTLEVVGVVRPRIDRLRNFHEGAALVSLHDLDGLDDETLERSLLGLLGDARILFRLRIDLGELPLVVSGELANLLRRETGLEILLGLADNVFLDHAGLRPTELGVERFLEVVLVSKRLATRDATDRVNVFTVRRARELFHDSRLTEFL